MSSPEKEAVIEASLHLASAQTVVAQMEQLLAQALAHCQRMERPSEAWEAKTQQTLRLLREDANKGVFNV